ncbi:MAG: methyl-accepting chemotaxis protein [Myxococcales bacterium]
MASRSAPSPGKVARPRFPRNDPPRSLEDEACSRSSGSAPEIGGAFLVVCTMLVALGAFVSSRITLLDDSDTELYEKMTVPVGILGKLSTEYERLRGYGRDMLLRPEVREETKAGIHRTIASLSQSRKEYAPLITSDEAKRTFGKYEEALDRYTEELLKYVALADQGKVEEAKALLVSTRSFALAVNAANDELMRLNLAAAKAKSAANTEGAIAVNRTLAATILCMLLLAIGLAVVLTRSITVPMAKMMAAAEALSRGDIDQSIDHRSEDETGKLADSLRDTIDYIQEIAKGAEALAAGDLSIQVKARSEADVLSKNFAQAIGTVRSMTDETSRLIAAAKDGALSTRGDASKFKGAYAGIVKGVNELLDAVIGPLNVAASYVDQISKGAIPPKISDRYNGDFNTLKDNLNTCIDTLNSLVAEMARMAKEHDAGDIDVFVPEDRFQGAYRSMAKGLNDMVKGHISVKKKAMACVAEFARGNFDAPLERFPGKKAFINETIENVRDNLRAVAAAADLLTQAAVEGSLSTRADASKFKGDWAKLVGGFNATLDALVNPLTRTIEHLEHLADGHVDEDITREYKGDYVRLKNSFNQSFHSIRALIADANMLSQAAVEGRLATRADVNKHRGDFRKIVEGVNATLDAVLGPINLATDVLQRLADQDLRARVTGDFQGDHTKIKNAVNQTASALHDALASVAEAVDQVASASEQIAATSQTVSQGASEQASAIEETSSNMEEMLGITKQNTDNTAQAKALATSAKASADKGSNAMVRMADAMQSVKKGAEGTAAIIADVSEIAFQTNLLALNAAVEAARAGDAGRGFAVVADEVRSLAQRAKEAAKKTEALIKESLKLAGDGESISKEVATDLSEIVSAVGKVTGIVGEIAASSTEQSRGIDQINKAISQMDKATQQAAGSAEESSSSAEELSSQAQALAGLVSRFKLERKQSARSFGNKSSSALRSPAASAKALSSGKPNGKANGHANGNGHSMNLKPEDVIPLESDPIFKDF